MRFKNALALVVLVFIATGCATDNKNEYRLIFSVLKDGEVLVRGAMTVESENGKIFIKAINENGLAGFDVGIEEKKFWVEVLSDGTFYAFGQIDVGGVEIKDGVRLFYLDIGAPYLDPQRNFEMEA